VVSTSLNHLPQIVLPLNVKLMLLVVSTSLNHLPQIVLPLKTIPICCSSKGLCINRWRNLPNLS
jgi:hypothetical protein